MDWIPHSRPTLGPIEADAAREAILSGYVGAGPRTREFEELVAAYVQRRSARATSTGTSALHLALVAAGCGPGESVIIPAFVCRAVLNAVLMAGAEPILADVSPSDMNVSRATAEQALRSREKADAGSPRPRFIIVVHSFGAPSDVKSFAGLGLTVIEDAASSFGAQIGGKSVGSEGAVSVLSFASTKMMTTGQGGMVLTDDDDIAGRVSRLLDYDSTLPALRDMPIAFNYGFSDVQAALGNQQLKSLPQFVERRRLIAARYTAILGNTERAVLPHGEDVPGRVHAYYRYIFFTKDAARVIHDLRSNGVDARSSVAHYLYDYLPQAGRFPACEAFRPRLVSLPIHPSLTDKDVERIGQLLAGTVAD